MTGETAIIILHQVLEVVPNGNWDLMLADEVTCFSREECREGTGEVALCGEFNEWYVPWPHQGCVGGAGLTFLHRVLHNLLLCHR